jgi:5-methylcytosine-specific restriction endonuclease McrA
MTQTTRRKVQPISPQRLAELRALPYSDYLKTPEWNRRRQVALKIAEHRCQLCNSEDSLTVHHRSYRNLGAEKYTDLIVLCWPCHQLFHERRRLTGVIAIAR